MGQWVWNGCPVFSSQHYLSCDGSTGQGELRERKKQFHMIWEHFIDQEELSRYVTLGSEKQDRRFVIVQRTRREHYNLIYSHTQDALGREEHESKMKFQILITLTLDSRFIQSCGSSSKSKETLECEWYRD